MKLYGYMAKKWPVEVGDVVEVWVFEGAMVQAGVPLDFSEKFAVVLPKPEPAEA